MARPVRIVRLSGPAQDPTLAPGMLASAIAQARSLLADRLVRNMGWYGLAEFGTRLSRLVTTVVLARWLSAEDLGFAAIAMTTFEILRIIAQTGVGQAVGRVPESELAATCATAHRLSWALCMATMTVQLAIGAAIAWYYGRPELFWMIACCAGVYLTLPFGQIQAHLIVRTNRLHVLAGISVVQVAADNLLVALFAIAGFGAWSIILPKLITAPIWVIGMRRAQSWQRDPAAGYAPWQPIARFATTVISSDLVVASRLHLDKILVGAMLGVEGLGIYYFIFNAGIGFSLSVTSSLAATMYPHLAELAAKPRELLARYDGMLRRAVLPSAGIIALQACLALIYVPIVFGPRFASFAPLVAILCASAVTKPLYDSAAQLLRTAGLPHLELAGSTALTCLSLAALACGLPLGLWTGVIAMSAAGFIIQTIFAIAVRRGLGMRLASHPWHAAPYEPAGVPV